MAALGAAPHLAFGQDTTAAIPAGTPPPIAVIAPSAALNAKEARGVGLANRWAAAHYMPQAAADGVVRFPYGATLPTVVCAPLQVCDLELQPGEVVNNINAGDKVRWSIMPGISGSAEGTVTHLLIKPMDAGLVSNVTVLTNRRSYSIKLVSTQTKWMPRVGFSYPDEQVASWSRYQASMASAALPNAGQGSPATGAGAVRFYHIACSNNPPWKPLRAYSDGLKTYVEFGRPLNSGAPALVGLASDGGLFSRPTEQVVNYRPIGNRYVADAVLPRAALIQGVGGDQQQCVLTAERG